jgi:DNA polymerase-4
MARCIFHIDLDAFFVSVEQVLNPKLKGKLIIVGGYPERRELASNVREGRKNLSPKLPN